LKYTVILNEVIVRVAEQAGTG